MSKQQLVSASDPVETSPDPLTCTSFFSAKALAELQEPFESEHVKHWPGQLWFGRTWWNFISVTSSKWTAYTLWITWEIMRIYPNSWLFKPYFVFSVRKATRSFPALSHHRDIVVIGPAKSATNMKQSLSNVDWCNHGIRMDPIDTSTRWPFEGRAFTTYDAITRIKVNYLPWQKDGNLHQNWVFLEVPIQGCRKFHSKFISRIVS